MIRTRKPDLENLDAHCDDVAQVLKALAHPQRLLMLRQLADGEKTVSELQGCCGLSQSHLSQTLARMKLEGIVNCRKEGTFAYYSISEPKVLELIKSLSRIFC